MQNILFIVLGVITGIFAGIFGVGGGIVLIPLLVFLFKYPQATANGISLVALLLPVGTLAVIQYYKSGKITSEHIYLGLWIAGGIFLGSYFGAKIATALPTKILQRTFAGFLVLVAFKLWFSESK